MEGTITGGHLDKHAYRLEGVETTNSISNCGILDPAPTTIQISGKCGEGVTINFESALKRVVATFPLDSAPGIADVVCNNKELSFSSPQILSDDVIGPVNPQVVGSGKHVYVAFQSTLFPNNEIYLTSSRDHGKTFGDPTNISENEGSSTLPVVAASDNHFYIAWTDHEAGKDQVLFRSSDDGGASFESSKIMSNAYSDGGAFRPQIEARGKHVYLVWEEKIASFGSSGQFDIFFARSSDFGKSFDIENLSHNKGDSLTAQLAISGKNVYVVWSDYTRSEGHGEIYFRASSDSGHTFDIVRNLSDSPGPSIEPLVKARGDSVYVVWNDGDADANANGKIFFRNSADNGRSFGEAVDVTAAGGTSLTRATTVKSMSAPGADVYIAWQDNTDPGTFRIYFISSNDKGTTFGNPKILNPDSTFGTLPEVVSKDGRVFVSWNAGFGKLVLRTSTDHGETFGLITEITRDGAADAPEMFVDGKYLYMAWPEFGDSGLQILLARGSR
jgi:hypothetical protein